MEVIRKVLKLENQTHTVLIVVLAHSYRRVGGGPLIHRHTRRIAPDWNRRFVIGLSDWTTLRPLCVTRRVDLPTLAVDNDRPNPQSEYFGLTPFTSRNDILLMFDRYFLIDSCHYITLSCLIFGNSKTFIRRSARVAKQLPRSSTTNVFRWDWNNIIFL